MPIKITVKPAWRNHGISLGLEFDYLFAEGCVWNRRTGEVVFVAPPQNGDNWQKRFWANRQAELKCYELNGLNPNVCEVDYDSVE